MRNLRNVNKPVDSFFNFNECAETCDSYDFTLDNVADSIFIRSKLPGLRLKLFITERNLLGFLIAFKNLKFVLLTDFKNFGRSFSVSPAKVGDVSEAIETVNVDKRAECSESYDSTRYDVAFVDRREEFLFFLSFCSVSFGFFSFEDYSLRADDLL